MANFNLNKVILGGRLTATPELKMTQSGIPVVSFNLAVSRRFVPKKEDGSPGDPQADFISCVAWRQPAELLAKYFEKGSPVCITGELQTRTYVDKLDVKHYVTEVKVDEVYFVESKADREKNTLREGVSAAKVSGVSGQVGQAQTAGEGAVYDPYAVGNAAPQFELIESDDVLPF